MHATRSRYTLVASPWSSTASRRIWQEQRTPSGDRIWKNSVRSCTMLTASPGRLGNLALDSRRKRRYGACVKLLDWLTGARNSHALARPIRTAMASSSTSKPKLLRKVSTASGAAALKTFEPSVNETWMEALDTASGRLYFVKLEVSASGDAVKPQGDTSWQPPAGFLVRHELVAALSVALDNQNNSSSSGAGGSADDEAAFIEKVKQRFPPPSTPRHQRSPSARPPSYATVSSN